MLSGEDKRAAQRGGLNGVSVTVLGGGFLASHLIPALVVGGADVTLVARSDPGIETASVDVVRADLTGPPRNWIAGSTDVVVHLATRGGSIRDDEGMAAELVLLEKAIEATRLLGASRFVFLGSADEYGSAPAPQSEDGLRQPLNWYGRAKARATDRVLALASVSFGVTVLRPFSVYGERQPERMFIAGAIRSALTNSPFRMSLGTQIRDFVYAGDVASAISTAIERRAEGVFNVGTGIGTSLINAAERVRGILPHLRIERGDSVGASDPRVLVADTRRTATELGWKSTTSFDAGLARVIEHERSAMGGSPPPRP